MITEKYQLENIRDDALAAIKYLEARCHVIERVGMISKGYAAEKAQGAKRCIDYILSITGKKDNNY